MGRLAFIGGEGQPAASAPVEAGAGTVAPRLGDKGLTPTTNKSESESQCGVRGSRRIRRLLNRWTGEVSEVDVRAARVARVRSRVRLWSRSVEAMTPEVAASVTMAMYTLTYRPGEMWRADDIAGFLDHVRYGLGSALVSYAWAAELQQRGAIHYHVVVVVANGTYLPCPDTVGWWTHGTTNRVVGVRSPYYLCKYVSKGQESGEYPRGARIVGVSWRHLWAVVNGYAVLVARRMQQLPGWVRALVVADAEVLSCRRHEGGGWWVCGRVEPSPWVLLGG